MTKKIITGRDDKLTVHHKVPAWEGGNLHPDNQLVINEFRHRIFHILTDKDGKASMPIEILQQHLSDLGSAYVLEFREGVLNLIEDFGDEVHNPKCFKKGRHITKTT